MAAVTELATAVGTRAACRALFAPRASYYRRRRSSLRPEVRKVRPSPARALCSGGMPNSLDASARRALPGSLTRRCLCDVARCKGSIYCSIRTMYRLLERRGESA